MNNKQKDLYKKIVAVVLVIVALGLLWYNFSGNQVGAFVRAAGNCEITSLLAPYSQDCLNGQICITGATPALGMSGICLSNDDYQYYPPSFANSGNGTVTQGGTLNLGDADQQTQMIDLLYQIIDLLTQGQQTIDNLLSGGGTAGGAGTGSGLGSGVDETLGALGGADVIATDVIAHGGWIPQPMTFNNLSVAGWPLTTVKDATVIRMPFQARCFKSNAPPGERYKEYLFSGITRNLNSSWNCAYSKNDSGNQNWWVPSPGDTARSQFFSGVVYSDDGSYSDRVRSEMHSCGKGFSCPSGYSKQYFPVDPYYNNRIELFYHRPTQNILRRPPLATTGATGALQWSQQCNNNEECGANAYCPSIPDGNYCTCNAGYVFYSDGIGCVDPNDPNLPI